MQAVETEVEISFHHSPSLYPRGILAVADHQIVLTTSDWRYQLYSTARSASWQHDGEVFDTIPTGKEYPGRDPPSARADRH